MTEAIFKGVTQPADSDRSDVGWVSVACGARPTGIWWVALRSPTLRMRYPRHSSFMKSRLHTAIAAAVLTLPASAFAQDGGEQKSPASSSLSDRWASFRAREGYAVRLPNWSAWRTPGRPLNPSARDAEPRGLARVGSLFARDAPKVDAEVTQAGAAGAVASPVHWWSVPRRARVAARQYAAAKDAGVTRCVRVVEPDGTVHHDIYAAHRVGLTRQDEFVLLSVADEKKATP